jgi:hypothetical protein
VIFVVTNYDKRVVKVCIDLFIELPRRREILGMSFAGSCIPPVLQGQKRPIAPAHDYGRTS